MSQASGANPKRINIVSFHSIKGGVGKTSICLLTFAKLAENLAKLKVADGSTDSRARETSSGDRGLNHSSIWVVDLDVGGRPMFYVPGEHGPERTDSKLDGLLALRSQAALRSFREHAPFLEGVPATRPTPTDSAGSGPSTPTSGYNLELVASGQPDLPRPESKYPGRFLGMTPESAFSFFRDATPADYCRLVEQLLKCLTAEPCCEDLWLLVDCPPGLGRANEALVHGILDFVTWGLFAAEPTGAPGMTADHGRRRDRIQVRWQPVVVWVNDYVLRRTTFDILRPGFHKILPRNGRLAFVQNELRPVQEESSLKIRDLKKEEETREFLKAGLSASENSMQGAATTTIPPRGATEQFWSLAYDDALAVAFERAGSRKDRNARREPLFIPLLAPRHVHVLEDDIQAMDIFGDVWGRQIPSEKAGVSLMEEPPGLRFSRPPVVEVEQVEPAPAPEGVETPPLPLKPEPVVAFPSAQPRDINVILDEAHTKAESAHGPHVAVTIQAALDALRDRREAADPIAIGNLAVEAERCRLPELAYRLYEVSRESKGLKDDFKLAAQYVSFLLDTQYKLPNDDSLAQQMNARDPRDPVEVAACYLRKFGEKKGELGRAIDKTRFDRLAGQLTLLDKEKCPPGFDLKDSVKRAVQQFRAAPSHDSAFHALALISVLKEDYPLESLLELADEIQGEESEEYLEIKRAMGDALAARAEPKAESRAIELYEHLQNTRLWGVDTKHNLATLLGKQKKRRDVERAIQLWFEAYGERPGDPVIVRSFAQRLRLDGKLDVAAKVLAGTPITAADLE
ncbi:MAG: hypothetical protein WBE26_12225 [Phycisphaerae bacterium]